MREVEIESAAATLDALVDGIGDGVIMLTRRGEPVATLRRAASRQQSIRLGSAAGLFTVPDDFDSPLPDDVLALFYDGPVFPEPPATERQP